MDKEILSTLIDKYLTGTATPEEEMQLLAWYEANETAAYTASLNEQRKIRLEEELFSAIRTRAMAERPAAAPIITMVTKKWWWGVASILVLALTISLVRYQTRKPLSFETAYGEIKTIVLPDSSEVTLNGNSSIRYAKNRELWLDGEAFFHVAKKPNRQRFIVHLADTLSIEVVGTEFNVQKRKYNAQIALKSGKIRLHRQQQHGMEELIDMEPNDVVYIGHQVAGGFEKARDANLNEHLSWRQHRIVLDDTSLDEIVELIRDTYGLSIAVSTDTILHRRATGSVPTNPSHFERLLNNIAELYNLTVTTNQINNMETQQHFILNPR